MRRDLTTKAITPLKGMKYLFTSLHYMLQSGGSTNWFASIILGWSIAPFIEWINKYIYSDWQFATWLLLIVVIDTATGMWASKKQGVKASSDGFKPTVEKLAIYGIFMIVIHLVSRFEVDGRSFEQFQYFRYVGYGSMMVREGWSVMENINVIHPGLVPKKITDTLKKFNSKEEKDE